MGYCPNCKRHITVVKVERRKAKKYLHKKKDKIEEQKAFGPGEINFEVFICPLCEEEITTSEKKVREILNRTELENEVNNVE